MEIRGEPIVIIVSSEIIIVYKIKMFGSDKRGTQVKP